MKTIFSVCIFFVFYVTAQTGMQIRMQKIQLLDLEREADANFKVSNFPAALPSYIKLDSVYPNKTEYEYRVGVCYLLVEENNEKALPYLQRCLAEKGKHPAALDFYLGKAYHMSHQFDKAIEHYTIYQKRFSRKNGKAKRPVRELARDIEMCHNGKALMANPVEIEIKNLGPVINSKYPDYGPVISADESSLFFTSNRPTTTGGKIDPIDGLFYEDVYISQKKNGVWSEPAQLSINTDDHDASIGLSPDGQTLFIYRYGDDGMPITKAGGDLYVSTLEGDKWSAANKLDDRINSRHWESSVTISEDGNTLYYTSNKPGGLGGSDIYVSKKLPDGSWDKPKNLGPSVNTKYDEENPVLAPDGKVLYFSSKGHNSMGGFDVFTTRQNEQTGKWDKPENMGYPISTAHDDLHFAVSTDGKRMYFSSVRPDGYGNKDLYCAEFKNKAAEKVVLLSGVVIDSLTKTPVSATIRLISDNNTLGNYTTNSVSGKYTIVLDEGKSYQLIYSSTVHGSHYEQLDLTQSSEYKELVKNVTLFQRNKTVTFTVKDKTDKSVDAKFKLINTETKEVIELGESAGYSVKLKEGTQYSIELNKKGFLYYQSGFLVPLSEQTADSIFPQLIVLTPISEGASMEIKNLYFATEEVKPLPSSLPELQKVVEFMKLNPETKVEIAAYTDDTGTEEFNKVLSENRAKEVMKYLVESGITQSRLVAKGYGMKGIEPGSSEEARAKNRRVELKVLKN